VKARDQVALKAKDPKKTGKAKTRIEMRIGDDLHRKSGRWYKLERIIDRNNKRYKEIVTNPETGEVVHLCDEPLDEHTGHGSDRGNRNP